MALRQLKELRAQRIQHWRPLFLLGFRGERHVEGLDVRPRSDDEVIA